MNSCKFRNCSSFVLIQAASFRRHRSVSLGAPAALKRELRIFSVWRLFLIVNLDLLYDHVSAGDGREFFSVAGRTAQHRVERTAFFAAVFTPC